MNTPERERVYDALVAPLMTAIIEICKQHDIPVFATFEISDKGSEDPTFCTTVLPGGPHLVKATNAAMAVLRPEPEVFAFRVTSGSK